MLYSDLHLFFLEGDLCYCRYCHQDEILVEHNTTLGIWRAMTIVEDKAKKCIQTKSFKNYVPIANPKNGNAFFDEVPVIFLICSWLLPYMYILMFTSLIMASFFELIGTFP